MSQFTGAAADEVFLGNTSESLPEHLAGLKTVRLGDVALDIDGKRLPREYRPMFLSRGETDAYNRIMMARFEAIREERFAR